MHKDPTEFKDRFQRWKKGEQVYEAGLPKYTDGKYVQAGKDNSWSRISDNDVSDTFQEIIARPSHRGGNATVGNWNRQWSLKGEPGLEIVSPEFDIISGVRGILNVVPKNVSFLHKNNVNKSITGGGPYYASNQLKKYIANETLRHSDTGKVDFFTSKPVFQLYKGIYDSSVPEETKRIYYNSILPRLEFMRPGYRRTFTNPTIKSYVDDVLDRGYTVYPKQVFDDAGQINVAGLHYKDTGHIAIKEGEQNFALGHELRHRLDRNLKLTDDELDILLDAYDPRFSILNQTDESLKDVANMNAEMVTTNFDTRKKLLGEYHLMHTPINLQNKIIDKVTDQQIFDALHDANGYGRAYIKQLKTDGGLTPEFANAMRKSLKYIGAFSTPVISYKKYSYKNGKLPKYEDGNEGYLNNFVNFGIGMIPIVGSIHDTYHAIKDPSLVNILSAGAGWGLDAMMLLGPAGVAIRQAGKAALKAKRAADAGKSLYRINKNTQLAKRQAQTAVKTALMDNRKLDAAVQLGQEAYDQYKQEYKNGKLPKCR